MRSDNSMLEDVCGLFPCPSDAELYCSNPGKQPIDSISSSEISNTTSFLHLRICENFKNIPEMSPCKKEATSLNIGSSEVSFEGYRGTICIK